MSENISVAETVKQIAEKILRKKDIVFSDKTSFKDFGADSLDIVQIMVAIEDKYDIELNDDELKDITNTAGFVAYIEKKIAEKAKRS